MTTTYHAGIAPINMPDLLAKVYRQKKPAAIGFAVLLFAGILLAIFLPPTYLSSSTILIEQQEIPQDLVRSTVTSYADQRIQTITQRTMTFSNLSEIIKKYDLYADDRLSQPLEKIIVKMRDDIKTKIISADVVDPRSGRPTEATIAFSISYQNRTATTAQQVANELTSLFLNENLKTRREMAALTEEFLSQSAEEERKKVVDLEHKISQFKQANAKQLPEYIQLNISSLDRTESEYREAQAKLEGLQERKIYLAGELARLGSSRIIGGDINGLRSEDKLQYLYNQSLQLKSQYAADHPDVVRANRAIDELVAQGVTLQDKNFISEIIRRKTNERNELAERYSPSHPDVMNIEKTLVELKKVKLNESSKINKDSNNPDYIQLAAQLQAVEQTASSTMQTLSQLAIKVTELQKSLSESPGVEQEYRVLLRDLETVTRNYKEFDAKQTQAKMAKALEQEQKGERFTLIEPPLTPVDPIKPNRTLLVCLAVVLGLAVAVGIIVLLEHLDTSIRGANSLVKITGIEPLAVIPYVLLSSEVKSNNGRKLIYLSSGIASLFLLIVIIHFAIKPLDVLMYALMRKLGV